MKELIIFQTVSVYILCHLMVSANVVRNDSNSLGISVESVGSDSSDIVNAKKTCDVILNFSNVGFTHIGKNLITSLHVKNLTLRDNLIMKLEKGAFDSLPNLEYLDVSRNKLSLNEFFSFGGHSNLKTLILNYNIGFETYYTPVTENSNVNYYGGYRNRYTTTASPTMSPEGYRRQLKINPSYYFPELEYLSLRKVNMDSLSADWIFNFPKLKYLDLSENSFYEPAINVYNNIPPTTLHLIMESADIKAIRSQQFKNITMLNLNHNHFDNISNRFCTGKVLCLQTMYNLQSLVASDCSISIIDADAFKDTPSLIQLDISNNKIVDLPHEIFQNIPSLVHLDLSKNNLNEIPDFGALKNLSSLKLDNMQNITIFNLLSSFPLMPNLTAISMRKNNLKVIPQSFLEKLPALREIDLSYNEITSLPPFMSQAVLNKLYLSFNRVSNIGDLSLKNALLLEILDLRNNSICGMKIGTLQMLPSDALLYL